MKTRASLLQPITWTLPLALLMQAAVLAQNKDETKPPPAAASVRSAEPSSPGAAGKGRQGIVAKLDRIRLNEVNYDALPLSEVVRHLSEEARKRDPEQTGINFLVNPNAPATAGEAPDINSVNVRVSPALRDVRLVDALDAIVKVADHPIQYSIEDYGVVFALKGAAPDTKAEADFVFPGGSPRDFLESVEKHFKVDWLSIASIPREMEEVRVPKLRFAPGPWYTSAGSEPVTQLVFLYNSLAERRPQLGSLVVKGDPHKPAAVLLVPDKSTTVALGQMKTKAFPLKGIPEKDWAVLAEEIARTGDEARAREAKMRIVAGAGDSPLVPGNVSLHGGSALLVVMGSETFVEMAESIVTAFQANQREAESQSLQLQKK